MRESGTVSNCAHADGGSCKIHTPCRAVVEELKIHRTTDLEEVIGLEVTARSYRYVQNVCATKMNVEMIQRTTAAPSSRNMHDAKLTTYMILGLG